MKKTPKSKKSKTSKAPKAELPELVTVMMKVAERLEALEKKTDVVIQQTAARFSEMKQAAQNIQRPGAPPYSEASQQKSHNRPLYQAICADCCKHCEVPFRPTPERPVYCKECFVKRKAGHIPQDPDKGSAVQRSFKPEVLTPPENLSKKSQVPLRAIVSKGKKSKAAKKKKNKKA